MWRLLLPVLPTPQGRASRFVRLPGVLSDAVPQPARRDEQFVSQSLAQWLLARPGALVVRRPTDHRIFEAVLVPETERGR